MEQYDILIIGSGFGGLVCADVLSREGFKVCVLEKNAVPGGCLQTYKRKGKIFDTGIHYVGCLDDGQVLNQYFKYLGIMDRLKIKRLDEDGFDVINIMGKEYKHAMGHENFIETLSSRFPKERENIKKIVYELKKIGDSIGIEVLREKNVFSVLGLSYFNRSAYQYLKENTNGNRELLDVFLGSVDLCGERDNISLYVYAMIINSNIESSYRFVDGSRQVADLLVQNIEKNGGEVRTNAEVTRINVRDGLMSSVEINRSELIKSKFCISDIHPSRTLELVEKTNIIKKAYISRINSLRESMGFFTVSVVFKENAFEYQNKNNYYYDSPQIYTSENYCKNPGKKMLFCTSISSSSEKYASVAQLLEPMFWSEMEKWIDTTVERRGEEYLKFKQYRAELLLDLMEKYRPGFKQTIDSYYTSTPLTYRDYTGTKNGSAYGIVKHYDNALASLLPTKTRIPNLYFTGQNNNVHGMIGVILTAMYTCAEFTDMKTLAKKIGDAC